MQLESVNSSAIRAVGYEGSTLTVEFHNGRIYNHPGVPYSLFEGLVNADSPCGFYNHFIRRKFK
jgi:hypothetical protein